jgi:hypothetical protein
MKIRVVQACADGILAKTRRNAKSAKTTIKKGYYTCFWPWRSSRLMKIYSVQASVDGILAKGAKGRKNAKTTVN